MTTIEVFEWCGTILGLIGSYTLALNIRISRYGWFVFLAANIAMGLFGLYGRHYGVLLQSLGFTGSSLIGVYRAFVVASRQLATRPALRLVQIEPAPHIPQTMRIAPLRRQLPRT